MSDWILIGIEIVSEKAQASRFGTGVCRKTQHKKMDIGVGNMEMLFAKKAMDACGFRKVIFVSSPYRMRRIKIMAGRVFDSSYEIKTGAEPL